MPPEVVDNYSAFTTVKFRSLDMLTLALVRGEQLFLIEPGKLKQNAYIESFKGRFRPECLDEIWFTHLQHARVVLEACRKKCNEESPKTLIEKQLH